MEVQCYDDSLSIGTPVQDFLIGELKNVMSCRHIYSESGMRLKIPSVVVHQPEWPSQYTESTRHYWIAMFSGVQSIPVAWFAVVLRTFLD
jgi:hypothetical protein